VRNLRAREFDIVRGKRRKPAADAPVPQHSRTTRGRDMTPDRLLGLAIAAGIGARAALIRRPRRTLIQRLAEFPTKAPVKAPLRIHWNEQQVPFVDAQDEGDLAVGLGMVHAHLRLAQMEIMRRAAQGRLSELIGPLGLEADRAMRLLDLGRAVPAIIAGLTPDTRAWAEGFVRGVNHVLQHVRILPEEMRLLGIGRDPWSLTDLLTNARLAGADVNWAVYGRLLRARAALSARDWQALWPRLLANGMPNPETALAGSLARAGSNAAAVAGWRSRSGSALFAADPHLSIALPNVWLAVGMHAPTLNVVGLMPAGFPLVAIGRNAHIAWGGTSLHAAASDLIDVSGETLDERVVSLRVRGTGTRTLTLRRSVHGPVVSDGMLLRYPTPLALRWVGHTPSDEIGAMLGVMRAGNSEAFAAALQDFAIPGQNMLHATVDGHVGHLLALAAPRRPATAPADLVLPPEAAGTWNDLAHTSEFFNHLDPASGVVASANDEPPPGDVPAGFFFSPPDRVQRLRALLGAGLLDLEDMARTQTDVQGRIETVRAVAERLPDHPARTMLLAWNGCYDIGSKGAVLFEALMADLAGRLPEQAKLRPLTAIWTGRRLLAQEVLALDDATLRPLAIAAMDAATALLRRQGSWGKLHRMRIRHYFGMAPLVGWRYRFGAYGAAGGNDTLNKTGHGPVRGRHGVSYGASARFLADMADPDANRVVLLGGQDGWLGSDSFADQVPLWRRGDTVALPLRVETARGWPHVSVVRPA